MGDLAVTRLMPVCPQCGTHLMRPSAEAPILQLVAVTCLACQWAGRARFWELQGATDADV